MFDLPFRIVRLYPASPFAGDAWIHAHGGNAAVVLALIIVVRREITSYQCEPFVSVELILWVGILRMHEDGLNLQADSEVLG